MTYSKLNQRFRVIGFAFSVFSFCVVALSSGPTVIAAEANATAEKIEEALDAGFEFEGFSDLHSQPDGGLIHNTTHESLNRNSDRFTLKFRKPNKSN